MKVGLYVIVGMVVLLMVVPLLATASASSRTTRNNKNRYKKKPKDFFPIKKPMAEFGRGKSKFLVVLFLGLLGVVETGFFSKSM